MTGLTILNESKVPPFTIEDVEGYHMIIIVTFISGYESDRKIGSVSSGAYVLLKNAYNENTPGKVSC